MLLISGILFFFSLLAVYVFHRYALKKDMLDHPNERSSHQIPTPRGGGIVLVFLWSVVSLFLLWQSFSIVFLTLILTAFVIGLLGFLDDKYDLSVRIRMAVQFMASFILLIVVFSTTTITNHADTIPLCDNFVYADLVNQSL